MRYYLAPPPQDPLSRIVAGIVAVLALIGAFFFGMFVLALAVGLGVLAWLGLTLRMWWLHRRWAREAASRGRNGAGRPAAPDARGGDVIDADYEVIARRDDD